MIPESFALFSLPPTANKCQPVGVRFNNNAAIIESIAKTYTPAGIPNQFAPSAFNPTFPSPSKPPIFGKVAPPERKFASPRQIYIVPSVVINAATFNFVMIKPLISPIKQPIQSINTIIAGTVK